LHSLVTERVKSLGDWLAAICHLVAENFDHKSIVACKLHACNDDTAPVLFRAAFIWVGRANNAIVKTALGESFQELSDRGICHL
jgi:hypothetical protein